MDKLNIFDRLIGVFGQGQRSLVLLLELACEFQHFLVRPQFPGCCNANIHTHQATGDHQRVTHVGTCITHESVFVAVPWLRHKLTHCHQVGAHLCRMKLICQAVEYRYACVICQFLNYLLACTPIFDGIVHTAQHAGSILD